MTNQWDGHSINFKPFKEQIVLQTGTWQSSFTFTQLIHYQQDNLITLKKEKEKQFIYLFISINS